MRKIVTINRYLDYPPVRERYPNIVIDSVEPPLTMVDMIKYAIRVVLFSDYDGFFAEGTRQIFFMALFKRIFAKRIILVCRPRLKAVDGRDKLSQKWSFKSEPLRWSSWEKRL